MADTLIDVMDSLVEAAPDQPLFHYYDARGRLVVDAPVTKQAIGTPARC